MNDFDRNPSLGGVWFRLVALILSISAAIMAVLETTVSHRPDNGIVWAVLSLVFFQWLR